MKLDLSYFNFRSSALFSFGRAHKLHSTSGKNLASVIKLPYPSSSEIHSFIYSFIFIYAQIITKNL